MNDITVTISSEERVEAITTLSYARVAAMTPTDFGDEIVDRVGDELPQSGGEWTLLLKDGNDKYIRTVSVDDGGNIPSKLTGYLYKLCDDYRSTGFSGPRT